MIKRYLSLLISSLLAMKLFAQAPLSLYYLENVPQSSLLNAAKAPRCNGYFGVPGANGVYNSFYTNIAIPDLFQKQGDNWYFITKAEYNYDALYKQIGKAATVQYNMSLNTINMGWRMNKGYLKIAITDKYDAAFYIPKDFLKAADKSMPAGSKFDFSTLAFNTKYYRELLAGYQYELSSELNVGIHAKVLFGLAAFKTNISRFTLETDTSQWVADVSTNMYASFPVHVTTDEYAIPDTIEIPDMTASDIIDQTLLNFKNPGLAFDLGAEYILDENFRFSGAINDLGFILWRGDLNSFHADGKYTFEGLNLTSIDADSVDLAITELTDSLKSAIELSHRHNGFTTGLSPKMYLGAQYTPNHYFSFGFLSKSTFAKNAFQQEFNVSANLNLYRSLSTTLNYTVSTKGAYYLGFGFATRLGPFQFYSMLDYLPTSYRMYEIEDKPKIIGPYNFQHFNLMFGLNLIFGANGYQDEPMIDAYSEF